MSDTDTGTYSFVSRSERFTENFGEKLGGVIQAGDAVLLSGDLGAGKTCIVRGLARGAECVVSARSPTFIIVAEYPGRVRIFHCDLYRVSSEIEIDELALEENLGRGALAVEWPENGFGALPGDSLTIAIDRCAEMGDDARRISLSAKGDRASGLLQRLTRVIEDGETR